MLKLHHATSDGLGIVDLLSNLHSRTRESNPDKPQPLPPVPEYRTPAQELAHQLARDARALPGHGRAAARRAGCARSRARPRARASAARFGGSLRRVLGDGGDGGLAAAARVAACRGASARSTSSSPTARRVEGGRRVAQRRVPRGAAGRVPPLPRGARAARSSGCRSRSRSRCAPRATPPAATASSRAWLAAPGRDRRPG